MKLQPSLNSCFAARHCSNEGCKLFASQMLADIFAVQTKDVGFYSCHIGPAAGVYGEGGTQILRRNQVPEEQQRYDVSMLIFDVASPL